MTDFKGSNPAGDIKDGSTPIYIRSPLIGSYKPLVASERQKYYRVFIVRALYDFRPHLDLCFNSTIFHGHPIVELLF